MCDNFERPPWVELLPSEGPDSDAFDEESHTEFFSDLAVDSQEPRWVP